MKNKIAVVLSFSFALTLCSVTHAAEWVQTWGAAPLPPTTAAGPFPASPSFENVTIRQIVRVSAGGQRIRIRFTNEYGAKPLMIGSARVALADEKGLMKAGSGIELTFAGKASVTIPTNAPYLSDPINLPIGNLATLSISVYFPKSTGPCTCHTTGMQKTFVSSGGDFTNKEFTPQQTVEFRAFLSGVDVEVSKNAQAIVVLGDSISDGMGSSVDANQRWPDILASRLNTTKQSWGVVNMGISGNQVLTDGFGGQSALARFDRDVLSVAGVKTVVIFEGINDIGVSYAHFEGPMAEVFKSSMPASKATAESMIAGYRQLIARAHARGLKVLAATITPYAGAAYYSEEGETVRQAINTWIRTGKETDGVLDFDAVIRDASKPSQIRDGFHPGDHLHGTDAAYAAMAAAVDLSLLK